MKIVSIVGARPQFIKLAPLSSKLKEVHEEIIVHTGQHYDYIMSEKMFADLNIKNPDIHLKIGSGSHAYQTGEMMKALEVTLVKLKPDLVIVFGDTNSTLAGALAASKLYLPVLHIEAGLRSFNKSMPEEINRIVTDHISTFLFAPTRAAVKNLYREGLESKTSLTGDIMVDTLNLNLQIALQKSKITELLNLHINEYNLLTLHRDYNVDNKGRIENLLIQLGKLEDNIIFPVHPRTRKNLDNSFELPKNIKLIDPLGYFDFIVLEYFSRRIITDSGGIQKEAYILKKPCITLRTETEWVETVEEGWNLLVSPFEEDISSKISSFFPPQNQNAIFGDNVTDNMIKIINSLN